MLTRNSVTRLLPILAGLAVGCSVAHAAETTASSSELESAATTKYVCEATVDSAHEENTVTINAQTGYVSMTRKYTSGGRVSTGTLQGYATVATGNLTGLADSQELRTYSLGDFGFAIGLDGSNPRMLVHGSIPCSVEN